jgi:hypothetical protein
MGGREEIAKADSASSDERQPQRIADKNVKFCKKNQTNSKPQAANLKRSTLLSANERSHMRVM